MEQELEEERGCAGGKASSLIVLKAGASNVAFDHCPLRWYREIGAAYLDVVDDVMRYLKYGELPNPGGMLDQDALFVQALEVIGAAVVSMRPKEKDGA